MFTPVLAKHTKHLSVVDKVTAELSSKRRLGRVNVANLRELDVLIRPLIELYPFWEQMYNETWP